MPEQETSRTYWCFISYRHADNQEEGREWATWLHHGLETYRVPADLVGRTNQRGETIPERIFPVFRDEEELAGGNLAENIREAIEGARSLIVICSPRTPGSKYVAEEIRTYEQLRAVEIRELSQPRRSEPIIAIVDGDPNDPDSGLSCIPKELRFRIDHEGRLTEEPAPETLWTDFRLENEAQGWTSPTPYRAVLEGNPELSAVEISERVETYMEKLETARLRIIAGILGVTLGELQRREESYRLAEARKQLFESSLLLGTQSAAPEQAIMWLWRARYALDDDDSRTELVYTLSHGLAERLPDALVHDQKVTVAAFTPDGEQVVTGSDDGTVRFWVTATGDSIEPALVHQNRVVALCVSPDGASILTGTSRGDIHMYDAATRRLLRTVSVGNDPITTLQFDLDGTYFLAQSGVLDGSAIAVYETRSGKAISHWVVAEEILRTSAVALTPTGGEVLQGAFGGELVVPESQRALPRVSGPDVERVGYSPSGDRFFAVGGQRAQLWDANVSELIAELKHRDAVLTATFSSDGTRVATGARDGTARVWSARTGKPVTRALRHDGPVHTVGFDPAGRRLVTGGEDQMLHCWSLPRGDLLESIPCDSVVRAATFDSSGRYVVSTSDGHVARLWRPGGKAEVQPAGFVRHDQFVIRVSYDSEGLRLLTCSEDGTSRLWDAETLDPVTEPLVQRTDGIGSVAVVRAAISPDGRRVATGSNGAIDLWDSWSGERVCETLPHRFEMWALRFAPDSSRFVSAGRYGTAQLWDTETGEPDGEPLCHEGPRAGNNILDATFSPDGKLLASAGESRKAIVWRLSDRETPLAEISHNDIVGAVAFSPDSSKLATGCNDGSARIWDTHTGEPASAPLSHGGPVGVVVFSPDGKLLLTGSHDRTVRLWSADTGSPMRPPLIHRDYVTDACFRLDGTMFATADGNGSVRVWESMYGMPVTDWLKHPGFVGSVTFHPRGRKICTSCKDGLARVWSIVPDDADAPERLRWYGERKTGWFLDPERIGTRLSFDVWRQRLE